MATTSALDLIKLALKKARVLGTGDILSDEDAQDSLDTLNLMLDSWSLDRLFVYVETLQQVTLTGALQYTVGAGGDFNFARPNELISAYAQINGVSYPMEILQSGQQYDNIRLKGLTQPWPACVWYEKTYPLGTLHFYPLGASTCYLRFTTALQQFATLNTAVALPSGYKKAIVDALAVELAQANNTEISPLVVQSATNAISRLKRLNSQPATRGIEASVMASRFHSGSSQYNILSDGY